MNIVDVLIIGIVLLGALQGYRRGLLRGAVNLLGTLAGFLIASFQYEAVLTWIEQHFPVQNWLEPIIYKVVSAQIQAQAKIPGGGQLPKILGGFSAEVKSLVGTGNLSSLQSVSQGVLDQAAQSLASTITDDLLRILAFGLVFYAVVLLVHLGVGLLIPLMPLGGPLNHGSGLILGGLTATVALAVLAGLFSPFLTSSTASQATVIKSSYLFPYLLQVFQGLDKIFSLQLVSRLLGPLQLHNMLGL